MKLLISYCVLVFLCFLQFHCTPVHQNRNYSYNNRSISYVRPNQHQHNHHSKHQSSYQHQGNNRSHHQPQTGFITTRLQPHQQHRPLYNQSHHQHRAHHNQNQHHNKSNYQQYNGSIVAISNQQKGIISQPYRLHQSTNTSKPITRNISTTPKLPSAFVDKLEKDLNKTGTLFIIDVPCPSGTKYVQRTADCRKIF